MYQAGILIVSKAYSIRRIQHVLPPDHRIAAEHDMGYLIEYVIEGSTLPYAVPGVRPVEVEIACTMYSPDSGGVSVTAHWKHAPEVSWTTGSWPDMGTLEREMELMRI